MQEDNKVTAFEAIKFCYNWAVKSPKLIIWMLIPVCAAPISQSLLPFFSKKIIDIVTTTPANKLMGEVSPYFILFLSGLTLWEISWRTYEYFVDIKYLPNFRKTLVSYSVNTILKKNITFFQNTLSGKLTKRVFDLGEGPLELILLIFNRFPLKLFIIGSSLFILIITKIEFALVVLVWCVEFCIAFYFLFPKIIKKSEEFSTQESIINGQVTDLFTNILSVKLFANWKLEKKNLKESTDEYIHKEKEMEKSILMLFSCASLSFVILQGVSLYLLIFFKSKELITVGDFALVLGVNYNIVDTMWYAMFELMDFIKFLGKSQQALYDINSNNIESSTYDENAKAIDVNSGEIELKNVYFKHNTSNKWIFENFSCKINSGEKIGIVGKSGSSKTTFINILLRIYEINQGEILLSNKNIYDHTMDSIRKTITMIPQDPSLFCRSIYDNIRYGNEDASHENIINAAINASAHNFILDLEQGYDTIVGEKGLKISGGQRQRISVARAFLKNSPVLILDEATSALDSINEKEIQKSLWKLMQNKTCIVIAHRLSTLIDMDRILVFSEGKIIENGSHEQLISNEQYYYQLWQSQINSR